MFIIQTLIAFVFMLFGLYHFADMMPVVVFFFVFLTSVMLVEAVCNIIIALHRFFIGE
jgi:hypothetical protein